MPVSRVNDEESRSDGGPAGARRRSRRVILPAAPCKLRACGCRLTPLVFESKYLVIDDPRSALAVVMLIGLGHARSYGKRIPEIDPLRQNAGGGSFVNNYYPIINAC